jgi:hypothetical protein
MLSTEDLALLEAIRQTGSLSRAAAHLGRWLEQLEKPNLATRLVQGTERIA